MSRVRPILFNTDMVQAILDGRKTATRRVMKPANPFRNKEGYCLGNGLWIDGYSKSDEPNGHIKDYSISSCWMTKRYYIDRYAQYRIGDILYVRETWGWEPCWDCGMDTEEYGCPYEYARVYNQKKREYGCYCYKASMEAGEELSVDTWHPSIHMPKEAARIWLRVKGVRVEQLQDMTLDGFLSEGVCLNPEAFNDPENAYGQAKRIFTDIWNSTIRKQDQDLYGWEANPWVWVIEFERCEKPKEGKKDGK